VWMLALQLQNIANPVIFKFNHQNEADRVFDLVANAIGPSEGGDALGKSAFLVINDDYGQKRALWAHEVQNVAVIDVEKDIKGQAEMAVWQNRGNAMAQRMVQKDPRSQIVEVTRAPFMAS
jgi:hypothetical protein